jgi:hypothetical protein
MTGDAPLGTGSSWLGPEGEPLPFSGDAEVLEFLEAATVVDRQPIAEGINRSEKLLLEKGGVRAHAIVRVVEVERREARIDGRFYFRFRDSWGHECAAFEIARLLGFDNVPPVVRRRVAGKPGSVQIWVENTVDEDAEGFRPADVQAWVKQVWDQVLFDALIFNVDRNPGNRLVTADHRIWLIDHTRAFQREAELLAPEQVLKVRRQVWQRLTTLSDEDLRAAVRDYLDPDQLDALCQRRQLLLAHVKALVDERGAGSVFY